MPASKIEKFILVYIAFRSTISVFYDVSFLGFRITDMAGVIFPSVLIGYYLKIGSPKTSRLTKSLFFIIIWMFISSFVSALIYEIKFYTLFKLFFKFFNGFSAFLVFPFVFKNQTSINRLINAFLISTILPATQIFSHQFLGISIESRTTKGDIVLLEGVYGNYGIFALISWIGSLCIFAKLGLKINNYRLRLFYTILLLGYLIVGFATLSRTLLVILVIVLSGFASVLIKGKKIGYIFFLIVAGYLLSTSQIFKKQSQLVVQRSQKEIEIIQGKRDVHFALHGRVGRWQRFYEVFTQRFSFVEQLVGTNLYLGPHGDYFFWLFYYGIIGLILYLRFLAKLLTQCVNKLRFTKAIFFRYYGTMAVTSIFVWLVTAISTNPSFIPDFGYFVLGNVSIFLALSNKVLANQIPTSQSAGMT